METPKAVALLVMSYFSGHLWVFIVTAFLRSKTRGNKLLQSMTGKTAVGLLWFTAVMAPVYLLKHGEYHFAYSRILDVTIPTLVVGLFLPFTRPSTALNTAPGAASWGDPSTRVAMPETFAPGVLASFG